jgi:hypothetical protein
MLTYYVIYRNVDRTEPAGIFAVEPMQGHALVWDHRQRRWSYNPALATRFLDDHRNAGRYEEVDRRTADQVASAVTDGVELPDEKDIYAEFRRSSA